MKVNIYNCNCDMQTQLFQLCTRKCIPKNDIKTNQQLNIPQKNCFHRCSIKYLEALKFTKDTLLQQNIQIQKANIQIKDGQVPSLMDKLHDIYEQTYGKNATT